ncbi:hypothetical protein PABY_02400 [Pyrodictium abyssi]|uniref:Uncharacterized protein n=1 Tax=Pyrodictium abyssi TaxID=54256 RepID=A0ABN6ZK91_9CREN|nr:hypothetical protein PABY_02400 [Pyrodictium abyssi]
MKAKGAEPSQRTNNCFYFMAILSGGGTHSKLAIMQIKGELFGLILNSKLSTSSTSIMVNSVVLAKHRIMDN